MDGTGKGRAQEKSWRGNLKEAQSGRRNEGRGGGARLMEVFTCMKETKVGENRTKEEH